MHSPIYNSLPGESMPLPNIMSTLSMMWHNNISSPQDQTSTFRASQMNLILHFGTQFHPANARKIFNTAILFAQKHPCRIIVLCPLESIPDSILNKVEEACFENGDIRAAVHGSSRRTSGDADGAYIRPNSDVQQRGTLKCDAYNASLEGKLFSTCYIGKEYRDTCCCEALSLPYPPDDPTFLENQVSLWLEGDLPTYYWLNGVPKNDVLNHFQFINSFRKVIYDSAIESHDLHVLPWKNIDLLHDLADARLLHIKQSIGQFLSTYKPSSLIENLHQLVVSYDEYYLAEAKWLLLWLKNCLSHCYPPKLKARFKTNMTPLKATAQTLEVQLSYSNNKKFHWTYFPQKNLAHIDAFLNHTELSIPLEVATVKPEEALANTVFY